MKIIETEPRELGAWDPTKLRKRRRIDPRTESRTLHARIAAYWGHRWYPPKSHQLSALSI
ncbi:hypothetical protein WN944_017009 [Citrus x changshan-huyou]|uniref:Uncharacterized protein n=1 Tax=Citrus x changshan-huyou TaxID=2935761 RepID=A0AAP0QNE2_9ROSI